VSAEAIAAAAPDLVLLPAWTGPDLDASLHRFGIATLRVATPATVDDVRASIRSVAHALDASARGERLIEEMDASLDRTRARALGTSRRSALVDAGSGLSPGAGTLLAELVEIAGGELLLARLGHAGLVPLSLERELSLDPDVLLVDAYRADARSRGIVDATRGPLGIDPRLSVMRAARLGHVRPVPARFMLTTTHHIAETAAALFDALHGEST
jgi:iron complex transport system substrate-binding protein